MPRQRSKLGFIPPKFNPAVLYLLHWSLPILRRWRLLPWLPAGIKQIEIVNGETLVELLSQFQLGKIRLILAFRHCEVDDPISGLYLFRSIPKIALQQGITLRSPIHGHFMYDRGMTIWAGNWLGWLFARIGGVPVHRGKALDLPAIEKIRELLLDGRFPLVIAPEGATNGHSEIVSPLEPGVAQLAFWNVEDLAKANRVEEAIALPINIQYHYINPQWSKLDRLLTNLERDCGLSPLTTNTDSSEAREIHYPRLLRLGNYLVSEMERFYHRFYHYQLPVSKLNSPPTEADLTERLQKIIDISLQTGESYFNLKSQGNIIKRCRRLEEAGWNYIYRYKSSDELKKSSSVQRGLADWIAAEAELRMLHMRLAESFVAVQGTYISSKPSFERFAETTLILFDAIARIKGEKSPRRPRLGWRKSTVTVGEPINVSDRADVYRQNRQSAKKAVAGLTQDIQTALEGMIF